MIPRAAEVQALLPGQELPHSVQALCGDGSARRFYRVHVADGSFVLCVGPQREENEAYVRLGRYLRDRGVPVPVIHAYDPQRGWVLMQDLGDRNLLQAVGDSRTQAQTLALYRPVLEVLVQLQVVAGRDYDPRLGQFHTPYRAALMVEEEGLYFAREFAAGLVGVAVPAGYCSDVERLAAEAAAAPCHFLLHRDFQSRNIQLTAQGPTVIDFQGCRPGPLAYDVAALLLDPYTGLPPRVRRTLLADYRRLLQDHAVSPQDFDRAWFAVGAFRLLQALGAFAKLGGRYGKPGFLEHAATGLEHLRHHLGARGAEEFPALSNCIAAAQRAWLQRLAGA